MSKFESARDLADKVEWEGGVTDAIISYGIKAADLPDDTPPHIREAWLRIERTTNDANVISAWLGEYHE